MSEEAHAPSTPAITAPPPAPVPIRVLRSHGSIKSPSQMHSANTSSDIAMASSQRPVRFI